MPLKQTYLQSINRRLRDDPEWRRGVVEALEHFEQHEPNIIVSFTDHEEERIPVRDIFCQTHRPDQLAFEELIGMLSFWGQVLNGTLIYQVLQVVSAPKPDKDREANQRILDHSVEKWSARFTVAEASISKGTMDEDGWIEFEEPLIRNYVGQSIPVSGEQPSTTEPLCGARTGFPLEIGNCLPDQIAWHLERYGCVARFPYHHRFIIFLENVNRNLLFAGGT